jgi:RNA polymerase sigma factor (sigma-70 family)
MPDPTPDVLSAPPDDATLLADYAGTRSSSAFELLVARYGGLVYGVALRNLRDPAAAEDVAQQVFATVAQRPTAVRAGAVAGWLHTAARHYAADWRRASLRRQRRERRAARPESVAPHTDAVENRSRLLDEALVRLSRGDRDMVLSHYLGEQPYPALARAQGISEASARKRMSRAIERLRQYVAAVGEDVGVDGVTAALAAMPVAPPAQLARRASTAAPVATGGVLVGWRLALAVLGCGVIVATGLVAALMFAAGRPKPAGRTTTPTAAVQMSESSIPVPFAALTGAVPARKYVTTMAADAHGTLWVGTKDAGVWRFDPRAARWTPFTVADGLGDGSALAVACDHRGRVWVAHGRHGVSVYDGNVWQNYDVIDGLSGGDDNDRGDDRRRHALAGPIGEHVVALAVCPTTGDVWMATSAGLTRYADATDTWTAVTRADGLPSDLARSIAFDPKGNVYVGFEADGVAMADAADSYGHWRQVTAPFRPDPKTAAATGVGLPSGYVNDVMVAGDGRVYVGTPNGLGWSDDRGASWRFVRGADWTAKAQMDALSTPPTWDNNKPVLPVPTPPRPPRGGAVLAEDYVEALGETPAGDLMVGYRRLGFDVFQRSTDGSLAEIHNRPTATSADCIRALPRAGNGYPCVGSFITGKMRLVPTAAGTNVQVATVIASTDTPPLPSGARPAYLDPLNAALRLAAAVPPGLSPDAGPAVIPLADDWRTQGRWIGRYGRYWCVLPAIDPPTDYIWGPAPQPVAWSLGLGHSARSKDFNRYWTLEANTDPRASELPPVLYDAWVRNHIIKPEDRYRTANRNDDGAHYPDAYDGPNLVYRLDVPDGTFVLSAYAVNIDETPSNSNYRRDYGMIVRSAAGTAPTAAETGNGMGGTHLDEGTVLAETRVFNFGTGVYKRFLVRGPASLVVELARHNSFYANTAGLMLDLADDRPPPYFGTFADHDRSRGARLESLRGQAASWSPPAEVRPAATEAEAVRRLATELDRLRDWNPAWWATHQRRWAVDLARWYAAHPEVADPAGRAAALYGANLFAAAEAVDHAAGITTARDVEQSLKWDGHTTDNSGTEAAVLAGKLAVDAAAVTRPR